MKKENGLTVNGTQDSDPSDSDDVDSKPFMIPRSWSDSEAPEMLADISNMQLSTTKKENGLTTNGTQDSDSSDSDDAEPKPLMIMRSWSDSVVPEMLAEISEIQSAMHTTNELEPTTNGTGHKDIARNIRLVCKPYALATLQHLFYDPGRESPPPKIICWCDFLHAFISLGFRVEKHYGSLWLFIPPGDDEPIVFREPYHESKIMRQELWWYGRRLKRKYGWTRDTFVLEGRNHCNGNGIVRCESKEDNNELPN
jgi:hypothetical protein